MTMPTFLRAIIERDVTYSVVSQVFVSGFNFIVGIVAARLLGVADFGLFTLILMISMVSSVAQSHLLTLPMMTFAGSRPKRSPLYFTTVFRLGLVFSLISALGVMTLLSLIGVMRGETFSLNLLVAAGTATFFQNQQIMLRRVLFAKRRRISAAFADILRLALMFGFAFALFVNRVQFDVSTILYLLAASAFLATVSFSLPFLRGPMKHKMFATVLGRHWPMTQWMLLMLLVSLGQEQALWVIVGVELGDEAIGGLRAGQYLLGATHTIVMSMENHIPRNAAIRLRMDGREGLREYLLRQCLALGGTVIGLILLITLFAPQLLTLVFGAEYAVYAGITNIFALAYAVMIVRSIWSHYLRAIENTRAIFIAHLVSSASALLLIYPLMSQFGLMGVVYCIVTAQSICLMMIAAAVIRDTKSMSLRSPVPRLRDEF